MGQSFHPGSGEEPAPQYGLKGTVKRQLQDDSWPPQLPNFCVLNATGTCGSWFSHLKLKIIQPTLKECSEN